MRAVITDPAAPGGMRMGTVPEPEPAPDEAVVAVRHAGVNHGDLRVEARPPGTVLGADAAGIVVRPAADGTGPAAGTRVMALAPGAWAERVAVPAGALTEVAAGVDLAEAAAVPLAGITALRNLPGPLAGRRVLITGASGGVGRMAVQLAARGGAHVIAAVGSAARGAGLSALGAAEVVVGLDGVAEPVDLVLENVGGPLLVAAWNLLAPGGDLRSIGWASGEPAVLPPYATFALGPARTLHSFGDVGDLADDLARLARLHASGAITAGVAWRGSWDRAADAAAALAARRIAGKAVLDVS
ncbi:zinc-binding dehydrogenase [Actinomadura rayongensis]|uniref:Zinc-binding dehydrogenase n=1 Tax=Actinomadura rayongensis TaxID=1429076 RepID=A0A6I4WHA1_9ACTN|nr:zinc-binding dehydrogenase [Actinomadura rayongensis]MXQ67216.1 zinc-binding dehydrogenase [Actinomadura rayongensis]